LLEKINKLIENIILNFLKNIYTHPFLDSMCILINYIIENLENKFDNFTKYDIV